MLCPLRRADYVLGRCTLLLGARTPACVCVAPPQCTRACPVSVPSSWDAALPSTRGTTLVEKRRQCRPQPAAEVRPFRQDPYYRINPSHIVISRVFAPLSRALVGRGGARDVLGWTAVAQCPTLSAKYFSVSLKISICGLTNMAKSTTLPAFRQPVQWWPE